LDAIGPTGQEIIQVGANRKAFVQSSSKAENGGKERSEIFRTGQAAQLIERPANIFAQVHKPGQLVNLILPT